jgi:hypothetical protein
MGFHGCDRAVGERALAGDMDLPASDQDATGDFGFRYQATFWPKN